MNHKCFVFNTNAMVDIVVKNGKIICCRRCGRELENNQIEPKLLKDLQKKYDNKNH